MNGSLTNELHVDVDKNNYINIRRLYETDIEQVANARILQETENGNGATNEYIVEYKKVLKKLFDQNRIIGVGAFDDNMLVSLACFNLINFGDSKLIPYLCGVWTNPEYRGRKIANNVNQQLMKCIQQRKKELQPRALLTLEGTEAAFKLYKKLGYQNVAGEMSFLGDVESINDINFEESQQEKRHSIIYYVNKKPAMQIIYSYEQFFAHPSNIDGKMSRILQINNLQGDLKLNNFRTYLQHFFSKHRFCKYNVRELISANKEIMKVLGVATEDEMIQALENLSFNGINGKTLNIKRSNSVMEKNLQKELQERTTWNK